MKRIELLIYIIFAVVTIVGCEDNNVKKLQNGVKQADSECPISMGITGDFSSVKYDEDNNEVTMYYTINDELGSHLFSTKNKEIMRKQIRLSILNSKFQPMLNDIVNAKASLKVICKMSSSGKSVEYAISAEELKEAKDSQLTELEIERMMLENALAMQNAELTQKMDYGMSLTKIAIEGDFVVYYVKVDEDMFDINLMKSVQGEFKENMKQEMLSNRKDQLFQNDLRRFIALGLGVKFHYYTTPGNYLDVIFTPDELLEFCKTNL